MRTSQLLLLISLLALTTSCVQQANWTWSGDTAVDAPTDGIAADGTTELKSPDLTMDADTCTPDCDGRECGADGCGGTCGDCGDGDVCDGEEVCDKGQCLSGAALDCDDGNACTADSCDAIEGCLHAARDNAPCEDGNPCTLADKCVADVCQGGAWDPCDDENPCTDDACEGGVGCQHSPVPDATEPACDDGNPCTEERCESGECQNPLLSLEELVIEDCLCEEDADCAPLEDGDLCNGTLICDVEADTPVCVLDQDSKITCTLPDGPAPECNVPVCIPETGDCTVASINDSQACDDGDACTQGDHCDNGACTATGPVDCDDTNPCTDDGCEPLSGCTHVNNSVPCTDDDPCTHTDLCAAGVCAGTPYLCDAPGACESADGAACTGDGGCTYPTEPLDGTPCDDSDACTIGEVCGQGTCGDGAALVCDDDNPCTDDACEPLSGCSHTNNAAACDDDDPCSTGDHCDSGACATLGSLACDDANPCTDDTCVPGLGCDYMPNTDPCDDGDPGTVGDACVAGECVGSTEPVEDHDHDGVCPEAACALQMADPCPTVWTPDGSGDLCQPLPNTFPLSRSIALTQPATATGASTWRRTYEPVEIPLKNGFLDDSLVGHWKLDGGEAVDFSGNENHGTVTSAGPIEGAFNDAGGALTFDGISSMVKTDNVSILNGKELTLSAWIFPLSYPGACNHTSPQIVGIGEYGDQSPQLVVGRDTGLLSLHLRQADTPVGSYYYTASVEPVPTNGWHHVVGVYDGAVSSLYLDGKLFESEEWSENTWAGGAEFHVDPGPVRIGNIEYGTTNCPGIPHNPFHGSIDEVMIFNRALTPTEIAAYYHSHAPYGTDFVPGAQPDLDDVRVTEVSETDGDAHQVPFEILGPRPHPDTPCPFDDTDPTAVPHIADREDLCGVKAYWRLNGNGEDVLDQHNGANTGAVATRGRFGDVDGAMEFDGEGENYVATSGSWSSGAQLTAETWFRYAPSLSDDEHILDAGSGGEAGFIMNLQSGVLNCSATDQPTGIQKVAQSPVLTSSVWHHGACVVGNGVLQVYVDGMLGQEVALGGGFSSLGSDGNPLVIGKNNENSSNPHAFTGTIDEVLIHNVAKSPEYIYRRANPGVPTVRFLASTEVTDNSGDGFDWYDYALRWGNEDAPAQQAVLAGNDNNDCYGLLSPCIGYAGWWRFDEGGGDVAIDSSMFKHRANLGGSSWRAGRAGTAWWLDGATSGTVEHHSALSLDDFSVEVSCQPSSVGGGQGHHLVSKGLVGDPQNFNYFLHLDGDATAEVSFEVGEGVDVALNSSDTVTPDKWTNLRGSFGGMLLELYIDSTAPFSIETAESPGQNTEDLSFGAIAGPSFSDHFQGLIDSIRISNRRLSPDEHLHFPSAAWVIGVLDNCIPDCVGKECGDDSCGGSCWIGELPECGTNGICLVDGTCFCVPDCLGKKCGDDGCGGSCGTCTGCGESCIDSECVFAACNDAECGTDGCGGSCGSCGIFETCVGGQCLCEFETCGPSCCDSGEVCCDGMCCGAGQVCDAGSCCTPECDGKDCGPNACGGNCGECPEQHVCAGGGTCFCIPDCGASVFG